MFPLRTFACAAALTLLTSAGGLLTAASKAPGGGYAYNTRTVPLLSEALKLCISAALLRLETRRARRGAAEPPRVTRSARATTLYLIPSLLYATLNNVNFATLLYVDPATFQVRCAAVAELRVCAALSALARHDTRAALAPQTLCVRLQAVSSRCVWRLVHGPLRKPHARARPRACVSGANERIRTRPVLAMVVRAKAWHSTA